MTNPTSSGQWFQSQTFPVTDAHKVAFLFAGYRGKIRSFAKVIKYLNVQGYTVVAYQHDYGVLHTGDPQSLMQLIDGLHDDIASKLRSYSEAICVGVSIGAGLGLSVQRKFPTQIHRGIYAGTGVSPSESIFETPLFYFARKPFVKRGHTPATLYKHWQAHEITAQVPLPAGTSFVMALGTRDRVVTYAKASATLQAWQRAGVPITIITKRCGHLGIIRWYKHNFAQLFAEAQKLPH